MLEEQGSPWVHSPGQMLMWFRNNDVCEQWAMEQIYGAAWVPQQVPAALKPLRPPRVLLDALDALEAMAAWEDAKAETLRLVREVEDYTRDELERDYGALLGRLRDADVAGCVPKKRALLMQTEFPRLALAHSGLFSVACHRDRPPQLETILGVARVADARRQGKCNVAKARGIVMDMAERERRLDCSASL
ncbi:hypothetical protein JKP88DRAFT_273055 [Tribonema minus]|uniref:Uncharacterized protein n=1 Tax=Tribonema minus TaxID=303371 RepID=A0A836CFB0_9STRA|nr:hypothetical protein JKP88DRAFT_273055 [Tribonema minus]